MRVTRAMSDARHPRVVAVRHVAFEDLGLLAPLLDEAGYATSYVDAPTADLGHHTIDSADLLIVLGGPIGVYEADAFPFLTEEINLIERRILNARDTHGI